MGEDSRGQDYNLVWMDMEMSGLNPDTDVVLEIATVITDKNLNVLEHGPSLVINHPPAVLDAMDAWCKEHHGKSGLSQQVLESTISLEQAQALTFDFIKKYVPRKRLSPLCGNSIWQDRRFLAKYFREIDEYLHYRIVDVSSIKEMVNLWYAKDKIQYKEKESTHRALDDILESIDELKYYRDNFLVSP